MVPNFHPKALFIQPFNNLPRRLLSTLSLTIFLAGCQSGLPTKSQAIISPKIKGSFATEKKAPEAQPVSNLWTKVQHGLGMDLDQSNARIKAELKWYTNNQSYFNTISDRAAPYLYFIVEEAEKRNLPLELALMPVVESTFDPFAYSWAGASGLWQIMPGTADHFGLKQNWWYDGRRDVVKATELALNYMAQLYKTFGEWELALAAYNSGPGRVQRAVYRNKRKKKPTDFWHLDLPKETTAYVPKLIAIGKIIRSPAKYGITLPAILNKPFFKVVDIKGQLDMATAAQLADTPLSELYKLNPGMNRWSTPPEGPHTLAVPANKATSFITQLKSLPLEQRLQWQRYTVKTGDNLGKIATKYRTQVQHIIEVNKLDSNIIRVGQALLIPTASHKSDAYSLSLKQRQLAKQNRTVSGRQKYTYIVKPGDSFWSIAQNYNVSVNDVARWNNLSPKAILQLNQELAIWVKSDSKTKANPVVRRVKYKVRAGDSLFLIAKKFNLQVDEIEDWNTLDQKYIHPGQLLTLYVDVTEANY